MSHWVGVPTSNEPSLHVGCMMTHTHTLSHTSKCARWAAVLLIRSRYTGNVATLLAGQSLFLTKHHTRKFLDIGSGLQLRIFLREMRGSETFEGFDWVPRLAAEDLLSPYLLTLQPDPTTTGQIEITFFGTQNQPSFAYLCSPQE
jgi:hypothetical protein